MKTLKRVLCLCACANIGFLPGLSATENVAVGHEAVTQVGKLVKGNVSDANGEPIIGANVVVKGTTVGAVTDIDGNFALEVPESGVLVIS